MKLATLNNDGPWLRHTIGDILVGAAFGAAGGVAIFWILFGRLDPVDIATITFDFLPQTAGLALISTVFATHVVRRRVRRQGGPCMQPLARWPAKVLWRAVALAVVTLILAALPTMVLFRQFGPSSMPLGEVLLLKAAYGALLGGVTAIVISRAAFGDISPLQGDTGQS